MWLQCDLGGGTALQQLMAYLNGVVRCRCALREGRRFWHRQDLCQHLKRLSDDPWLGGSPCELQRTERRRLRLKPPKPRVGWIIYASDGASRGQGSDRERKASRRAVRYCLNGVTIAAACGRNLSDASNNIAEYIGFCDAVTHAIAHPGTQLAFRVDSTLVAEHVCGRWRCTALSIQTLYERASRLLRRLRYAPGVSEVEVEHVYRAYNTDADGVWCL